MQAQILNGLYVFIYYFFQICLFIFMKNAVRKRALGGAHLDLFFYGAYQYNIALSCASFSLAAIFRRSAHTHKKKTRFPLLRQQEWESSDFTRTDRSYYLNGSCLVKKTAAENQGVRIRTTRLQ